MNRMLRWGLLLAALPGLSACVTSYGSFKARGHVTLGPCLSSYEDLEDASGRILLRGVQVNESPQGRWVALKASFDVLASRNRTRTLYLLDTKTDKLHALALRDAILLKNLTWSADGFAAAAVAGISPSALATIRLEDPPTIAYTEEDPRPSERLEVAWHDGRPHIACPLEDAGIVAYGPYRIRTWKDPRGEIGRIIQDLEDAAGRVIHYGVVSEPSPDGRWVAVDLPRERGSRSLGFLDVGGGRLHTVDLRAAWELDRLDWSPDGSAAALRTGTTDTALALVSLSVPPSLSLGEEDPRRPDQLDVEWRNGLPFLIPPLKEVEARSHGPFRIRTWETWREPFQRRVDLEDVSGKILLCNIAACFSPDGRWAVVRRKREWGGPLWLLDLERGSRHELQMRGERVELDTLEWSPDGSSAALLVQDQRALLAVISLGDRPTVGYPKEDPRDTDGLKVVWQDGEAHVAPPAEQVSSTQYGPFSVRTWKGPGDQDWNRFTRLEDAAGNVLRYDVSVSASPNGRWVLAARLLLNNTRDEEIVVLDVSRGKLHDVTVAERVRWDTLMWSPDGLSAGVLDLRSPTRLAVIRMDDPPLVTYPREDERDRNWLRVSWRSGEFRIEPREQP